MSTNIFKWVEFFGLKDILGQFRALTSVWRRETWCHFVSVLTGNWGRGLRWGRNPCRLGAYRCNLLTTEAKGEKKSLFSFFLLQSLKTTEIFPSAPKGCINAEGGTPHVHFHQGAQCSDSHAPSSPVWWVPSLPVPCDISSPTYGRTPSVEHPLKNWHPICQDSSIPAVGTSPSWSREGQKPCECQGRPGQNMSAGVHCTFTVLLLFLSNKSLWKFVEIHIIKKKIIKINWWQS